MICNLTKASCIALPVMIGPSLVAATGCVPLQSADKGHQVSAQHSYARISDQPASDSSAYPSTAPATNDRTQPQTVVPSKRTYSNKETHEIVGYATFYSHRFAGRRTANGETYQPDKFTAAHRTLPFGTRLRVTSLKNNSTVVVRVNDRGPYNDYTRIIDLSRAAARSLGMIRSGVIKVSIKVLDD